MDVEKLISLVNERKPLWDMTDKSYHMRDIQRKLWQEVAVEISANVVEVKNKWRGLRDTFRKEYNKTKKVHSGDEAESLITSKWAYFKILLFLSHTVERRKLHGNVSPEKINDNNSDLEEESILEDADNADSQSIIEESSQKFSNTDNMQQPSTSGTKATRLSTPTSNVSKKIKWSKKSEKNSVDDKFLEIEKAKLEILSRREKKEDGEYQFLMSLLPFLKAIPKNRQLLVRNKLQQVLIEEEQLAMYAPRASPASCHPHEGGISTTLPSPIYTNTNSSKASSSCYSNEFTPINSPITLTESSEVADNSNGIRYDVPSQQSLSLQNYISEFNWKQ